MKSLRKSGSLLSTISDTRTGVRANVVERRIFCSDSADMDRFTPFVVDGWDTTRDCLMIRKVYSKDDVIAGILIDAIVAQTSGVVRYLFQGLILEYNTAAWNVNDFLYCKAGGTLTNNPADDPDNTVAQEIGIVIRSHATQGEIYVSAMASQTRYIKLLALALIEAKDAGQGSGLAGEDVTLSAGDGDGDGMGGDIVIKPGTSDTGTPGRAKILQAGTALSDEKMLEVFHDGTDAVIESKTGGLKLPNLTASKIVETDTNKKLTSADKKTAYNKDFGNTAGTVCQGNDTRVTNAVQTYELPIIFTDDLNAPPTEGMKNFDWYKSTGHVYVYLNGWEQLK